MLDILIKGAHVFAPDDVGVMDIGIRDGKIVNIGETAESAERIIEASNCVAMPGAVETHAHMLLPFGGTQTMNDFYDGTMAGAIGGVTTLIDFADQTRGGSAYAAFERRLADAKESAVDYSLHCTLVDINEQTLADMERLIQRGVTSFKFYTAYKAGGLYISEEEMERAFAVVAANDALATVHCENEDEIAAATERLIAEGKTDVAYFTLSRPDSSEATAIRKTIEIAARTGAKLLIRHVSSAAGLSAIARAQAEGQMVIAETCPHYLLLTRKVYTLDTGARYIVNPPIRGHHDQKALWSALQDGTKMTLGTDDCGFYIAQKNVSKRFDEIPGGMPGIETRVPVMLTKGVSEGKISMERLVHVLSTDVAKIYGIYPQKGTIGVGSDADIVLAEDCAPYPLLAGNLHEKSDYTPFEGMMLHQRIRMTIANGKVIAEDGVFTGKRGAGRFLQRKRPAQLCELTD